MVVLATVWHADLMERACVRAFKPTSRSRHRRSCAVSCSRRQQQPPFIKVCGVTNVEDAELAAAAGANLIGMILWPKAKRSISPATARQIAAVVRAHGAEPVAVFVDEDAATIGRVCLEADVCIAQLHGDGARAALTGLGSNLHVVYVMHADKDGTLCTPLPEQLATQQEQRLERVVDWILLDSLKGGSGESFDWQRLQPPAHCCSNGWLLAGGLGPHNVAEAIQVAQPAGVDVSSGVCGPDGLKKDAMKVVDFVMGARTAYCQQQQQQQQHGAK